MHLYLTIQYRIKTTLLVLQHSVASLSFTKQKTYHIIANHYLMDEHVSDFDFAGRLLYYIFIFEYGVGCTSSHQWTFGSTATSNTAHYYHLLSTSLYLTSVVLACHLPECGQFIFIPVPTCTCDMAIYPMIQSKAVPSFTADCRDIAPLPFHAARHLITHINSVFTADGRDYCASPVPSCSPSHQTYKYRHKHLHKRAFSTPKLNHARVDHG